LTPDGVILNFY